MTTLYKREELLPSKLKEYQLYLNDIYEKMQTTKDDLELIEIMRKVYKYFQDVADDFFVNGKIVEEYEEIKKGIVYCERLLPNGFITPQKADFKFDVKKQCYPYQRGINDILDWVVYLTRQYLNIKISPKNKLKDFNELDLANHCDTASVNVTKICKEIGIKSKSLIIYPGFTSDPALYNGNGYHCFNIVQFKDKKYLVDCTYRQFFTIVRNDLERIGVVGLSGCRAGVFMTLTKERMNLANTLIEKGWVEATPENLKAYFDGFAISYRNGLYYQITNDYSYTTTYTADDYHKFLFSGDNQVKREGEEVLGYQRILKPISEDLK